jgi:putative transcriptional regulator
MAKRIEEKNEFFESLKSGLEAVIEHAKGTRKDLRTTTLPLPSKELSAKEIANLRARLNVSQAVFARYLNISPKTVQSWEQATENPTAPASNSCQSCERIRRYFWKLRSQSLTPGRQGQFVRTMKKIPASRG